MLAEAALEMRLVDRDRNRDRIYTIEVDRDLFSVFTVTVTFGRSGSWERSRRVAVASAAVAIDLIGEKLKRRASARRRLGAGYELVAVSGIEELRRPAVTAWHQLAGADRTRSRQTAAAGKGRARPSPTAPALPLFGA